MLSLSLFLAPKSYWTSSTEKLNQECISFEGKYEYSSDKLQTEDGALVTDITVQVSREGKQSWIKKIAGHALSRDCGPSIIIGMSLPPSAFDRLVAAADRGEQILGSFRDGMFSEFEPPLRAKDNYSSIVAWDTSKPFLLELEESSVILKYPYLDEAEESEPTDRAPIATYIPPKKDIEQIQILKKISDRVGVIFYCAIACAVALISMAWK